MIFLRPKGKRIVEEEFKPKKVHAGPWMKWMTEGNLGMNVKGQDTDAGVQDKFHFFRIKWNCKFLSLIMSWWETRTQPSQGFLSFLGLCCGFEVSCSALVLGRPLCLGWPAEKYHCIHLHDTSAPGKLQQHFSGRINWFSDLGNSKHSSLYNVEQFVSL